MLGKRSGVLADLVRGGACGLAGGTLQVAVGWLLSQTLLPPWEDNNIAPRLMQRSLSAVGQRPSSGRDWVLGTLFHYAYAFAWGAVLARGRALSNLPALVVAAPVSLVVYTLAFSRVGAGTLVRAEAHPAERPANKQASLLGVVTAFTVSTGLLLDRTSPRSRHVAVFRNPHRAWLERAGPDYWF
jgi:hypothetical protein